MRRLAHAREFLDGPRLDRRVLEDNLRDLRRINRVFGGTALSIRALRTLVAGFSPDVTVPGRALDELSLLDVGTGAADIPLAIVRAQGPWRSVRITAVDSRSEVLDAARAISPGLGRRPDVALQVADGRSLPFADGEFDVGHASMVLHHLEPDDGVRFLRELSRVSSLGIVVNDLARSTAQWLGAWLVLHAITRNRFTLHDGPLSVRRAYSVAEARSMLAEAGLEPIHQGQAIAGHRWAIAAVRA